MSSSVIVTFIRHGESTDNLQSIWAGWRNAPLSNHGMNQARALGEFFADTHFTAILTSDLKRASTTAQALYERQKDPKPTFHSIILLRELNCGIAEGKPVSRRLDPDSPLEEQIAMGIYPTLCGANERFPGGESGNDLAERAKRALTQFVLPHVWQAAKQGRTGIHVAIVAHGLFLSDMISELLRMSVDANPGKLGAYDGLWNTAWTRVAIDIEGAQEGQPVALDKEHPILVMRVTDINRHSHIDNIVKRHGSNVHPTPLTPGLTHQKHIRAFFGGKTESLSVSESDAHDNATNGGDITQ